MNQTPPTSVVSLDQARRLRRLACFIAATMGAQTLNSLPGLGCALADLKHIPGPDIDVSTTRVPAPALRRELLGSVRCRRTNCILARLRDPIEGIAEVTFDIALYDTGVVLLNRHSLFTIEGTRWWLAGRPGEVLLRLTPDGPIPTLTEPWSNARERWAGEAEADSLISAFVWLG